jgi:hypothetical protein
MFLMSSEKNDMQLPEWGRRVKEHRAMNGESAEITVGPAEMVRQRFGGRVGLTRLGSDGPASWSPSLGASPAGHSLRCVWTRHLDDGRSCGLHVPLATVQVAWQRELVRGRAGGGFFHFAWRGEAWLAYGLPDGEVRGVYCPAHRAQREERLGYDPQLAVTAAAHTAHTAPQLAG